MSVIDSNLRFANALSITNSKLSTVLDGKYLKDLGRGTPLWLNIYLNTVFTTGADTLAVQIVSSSGADPDSGDVFQTIMPARAASAMLTTGLLWRQPLPEGIPYERVALYFVSATTLVAGKIDAFLTLGEDSDTRTTT